MDNYPMGVNGSHPYFNQPDPPQWPECLKMADRREWLCPFCEENCDCDDWMGRDDD